MNLKKQLADPKTDGMPPKVAQKPIFGRSPNGQQIRSFVKEAKNGHYSCLRIDNFVKIVFGGREVEKGAAKWVK